jgi:hypothetical protein
MREDKTAWLWNGACQIRGPLDAPKLKDYIRRQPRRPRLLTGTSPSGYHVEHAFWMAISAREIAMSHAAWSAVLSRMRRDLFFLEAVHNNYARALAEYELNEAEKRWLVGEARRLYYKTRRQNRLYREALRRSASQSDAASSLSVAVDRTPLQDQTTGERCKHGLSIGCAFCLSRKPAQPESKPRWLSRYEWLRVIRAERRRGSEPLGTHPVSRFGERLPRIRPGNY